MSSNCCTLEKGTSTEQANESPCGMGMSMPQPTPQHAWLQRFIGTWDAELEMTMQPDQPPTKTRGVETWRELGGFWIVSEGENKDFPYRFLMTLGYDPDQKKYIGSWADTMTSHGWRYEGTLDATGSILTLNTEAPFPPGSGKVTKFRDISEFKSDDHRVYSSSMLQENGEWLTHMRINLHRRK